MSEAHSSFTEESIDLSDNGLILNEKLIPVELIQRILCYVDGSTLLKCQFVCKRWNEIIMDYVWRRKAEIKTGYKIPTKTGLKSKDFYSICTNDLFGRNLVKNHSGEKRFEHWRINMNRGDRWHIECPSSGAPPLPKEFEFEDEQCCFATSYMECCKQYTIDLIEEGFTANILDHFQPPIVISEWYCCRFDCPAKYDMNVSLLNKSGTQTLDQFVFRDVLEGDRQNIWFKVTHEFKFYGKGLRKIRFIHRGMDRRFWAGHYGSKMARAFIKFNVPDCFKKLN